MSKYVRIQELGAIGENIVKQLFETTDTVALSKDKYDDQKDMTSAGKTIEVKTHIPIYKYSAFCLPSNQWKKADEVDRLIFVEVPKVSGNPINVFEAVTKKYYTIRFLGDIKRMYPIEDLHLLKKVEDTDLSVKMHALSPSNYKVV